VVTVRPFGPTGVVVVRLRPESGLLQRARSA
jgi:hypothetical protein